MIFFRSDYSSGAHPRIIEALAKTNLEHTDGYSLDPHCENAAALIKKRLGIENFLINHIGPTIGAHSGPGTIALFYMGDYR